MDQGSVTPATGAECSCSGGWQVVKSVAVLVVAYVIAQWIIKRFSL